MFQVAEITFSPHLEHYPAVVEHISLLLDDTRAFDGCIEASLSQNAETHQVFLRHVWRSTEHLDAYLDARIERGDFDFFPLWLMDEPLFRTYTTDNLSNTRSA